MDRRERCRLDADLIVRNARVATMNPDAPAAGAFAVRGGIVVDVGSDDAMAPWRGPRTRVLDGGGRRVMPGFCDSHMHLIGFGEALAGLPLADARTIADVANRVRERAAAPGFPPDAWIEGRGWDEEAFAEKRLPTRLDLDDVSGDHPVFLRRHCGHIAVANTHALRQAGLWPDPREVEGGVVDVDAEGRPTGILREAAARLVDRCIPLPSADDLRAWVRAGAGEAARWGITALHPNDGGGLGPEALGRVYGLYAGLAAEVGLPLRVWWDFPIEFLDEAIERGWTSGMGGGRFRVGAAKLFTDGSLGGHTAALFEPYADRPDTAGLLLWDEGELAERLAHVFRHGFAACLHAIGDRAAALAITAVQRAQAEVARSGAAGGAGARSTRAAGAPPPRHPAVSPPRHPAVSRPRLIHCQIMRAEQWPEMARAGIVADVQPRFVASDIPIVERRVGSARAATSYAWRSIAAAGVAVAFGSDCPVEPINPMEGVYAAVTRQTMDGEPAGGWLPDERLSVGQALACYTRGGAYAVGAERERGMLAPGHVADFVVLDADPFEVPAADLRHIRPLATYVDGQATWRDPQADFPD